MFLKCSRQSVEVLEWIQTQTFHCFASVWHSTTFVSYTPGFRHPSRQDRFLFAFIWTMHVLSNCHASPAAREPWSDCKLKQDLDSQKSCCAAGWKGAKAPEKDQSANWVVLKLNRPSYYKLLGKGKGLGQWRTSQRAETRQEEKVGIKSIKFH